MHPALVSVVLPTRNSGRFLEAALESVADQTYIHHEIVVVDACSTDNTRDIALRHENVRVVPQKSGGLGGAWNEGIEAARGQLIAFLDSDDLWHPDKLARQVMYLRDHPKIEMVATQVRFFLSPGEMMPAAYQRPGLMSKDHASFLPGNLLVRRRLFDDVGTFDPSLLIASDMDWFSRLQDHGVATHILPETLYFKRIHGDNLSAGPLSKQRYKHELLLALRASVLRKRNGCL